LQSALPTAALPFPSASVVAHTARGSSSFSVGFSCSQPCPPQLYLLPSASAAVSTTRGSS
jgi:hypothetical protein